MMLPSDSSFEKRVYGTRSNDGRGSLPEGTARGVKGSQLVARVDDFVAIVMKIVIIVCAAVILNMILMLIPTPIRDLILLINSWCT